MRRVSALLFLLVAFASCTDASLYSLTGGGPQPPDRVTIDGNVCVPLATGKYFPVRILFLFVAGAGITPDIQQAFVDAATDMSQRLVNPSVEYGLVAYQQISESLIPNGFGSASALDMVATTTFQSFNLGGPISLEAPLNQAEALISGDILGQCPGDLPRMRYYVVLATTGADTDCLADPQGVNTACTGGTSDGGPALACDESCVVTASTQQIMALQQQYGVGQIQVQPVYVVPTGAAKDPSTISQLSAIAMAGGTVSKVTTPNLLKQEIEGLNYGSLQQALVLKTLYAINRNAVIRNQQVVPDSDGDGLSDAEEATIGTDPGNPDTSGDGIPDGVKVATGLDPLAFNTIGGCTPYVDADNDGLTDCAERLLGTQACTGDTDGDGLADMVEFQSGTDPLRAEQGRDDDRDGYTNLDEVREHTDPNTADLAFRADHAYGYEISDGGYTADGRPCYNFHISNVGLVHTLAPSAAVQSQPATPDGVNNIAVYFAVSPQNNPAAIGIQRLTVLQVRYVPSTCTLYPPPRSTSGSTGSTSPSCPPLKVNDTDFELRP